MAGQIEMKLAELGITLPRPMAPVANYVPYVQTGNLVVVSGQVPAVDGKIAITGKLGYAVSAERGKEAARLCFINVLVHLKAACNGDLDRVRRVVRLGGFIACAPEFTDQALVMNGASDLAACGGLRQWPARTHDDRRAVAAGRRRGGGRRHVRDRLVGRKSAPHFAVFDVRGHSDWVRNEWRNALRDWASTASE